MGVFFLMEFLMGGWKNLFNSRESASGGMIARVLEAGGWRRCATWMRGDHECSMGVCDWMV